MSDVSGLIRQYQRESQNQPADYWFWLARPEVDAEIASLLIVNIQPGSLQEQNLSSTRKGLLAVTRALIADTAIQAQPALKWLRWAVEHDELFTDFEAERKRLKKILLAVDRNPGHQHELDALRRTLELERLANKDLARKLETAVSVCAGAEQEADDLRSQMKIDWEVQRTQLQELRKDLEREIIPPLERKIAELDNDLSLTKTLLQQAEELAKERPPYMLAIAGLLRLLLDPDRRRFGQVSAAQEIGSWGWYGAGESKLNHLFADANKAATEADKDARPKVKPHKPVATKASKA